MSNNSELRILLIEDDGYKTRLIADELNTIVPGATISSAASVHSAKRSIRTEKFDVVLLDMSLPSFDVAIDEPGGIPETFGGIEILGFMAAIRVATPTIVITQFEKFESRDTDISIQYLGEMLESKFKNFSSIIFFSAASDEWRYELKTALEGI